MVRQQGVRMEPGGGEERHVNETVNNDVLKESIDYVIVVFFHTSI